MYFLFYTVNELFLLKNFVVIRLGKREYYFNLVKKLLQTFGIYILLNLLLSFLITKEMPLVLCLINVCFAVISLLFLLIRKIGIKEQYLLCTTFFILLKYLFNLIMHSL
jgi:hypothetical protein